MKFCGNCGTPQNAACSNCKFENPPGFKFCGSCGLSLTGDSPAKPVSPQVPRATTQKTEVVVDTGERRHLTVMFCDLVGSTELSNRLDPEDLRAIIREYQEVCGKVVARYEGHIAQYLGDGIMVYFGFPVAHENDAHRAVSTGLGIIEVIQRLNVRLNESHGVKVSVRLGIHTGHVVIGDMGDGDQTQQLALGATPNIAARLEGLAEPNTVVISADTHKLISGFFMCEDRGVYPVKGISKPIQIFRAVHENIARTRLESYEKSNEDIPMVGRDEEIQKLRSIWEEAKDGRSNIVLLSGDPGVGKSRIIRSLIRHVAKESDAWLVFHHCSPYHKNTAFYPVAEVIANHVLQFKPEEPVADKIGRLEGFLLQYGHPLHEMVPLFAMIMALPLEGTQYRPTQFSPEKQKQKLIGALLKMYIERSEEQNLLVVYEDMQWIDSSTLEIITQLVNQSPTLNIMAMLSFRPEFSPPWRMQGHIVPISLPNLPHEVAVEVIINIAGGKRLPEEVTTQIINKTDGIPLFIEELTKMVLDSGMLEEFDDRYELIGPIESLAIPSTLHDSLVARLDRMEHSKEIAQLGATIGREFSYDLLRETTAMEEEAMRECLAQLVDADLLTQRGFPPNCTFNFRHALIKDAAYQSLLKSQRQRFHGIIAKAITQNLREFAEQKPEIVAYHFAHSSSPEESVPYWAAAASNVKKHLAYSEAFNFIDHGLRYLDEIDDRRLRQSYELNLVMIQAPLHLMTKGFHSIEAYRASQRMRALATELSNELGIFRALRGIVTYEIFIGNCQKALVNAREALKIAESIGSTELLMEAHRLVGQVSIYTGDIVQSLVAFDKSIAFYEEMDASAQTALIGADPGVFSLIQSSHVCWYLGFPDQAVERAKKATARAEAIRQPFSQALSNFIATMVMGCIGDYNSMMECAQKGIAVAKEFGINMFIYETASLLGHAEVHTGNIESGIQRTKDAIDWRIKHGLIGGYFLHMGFASEGYLISGNFENGLKAVEDALEYKDKSDDLFYLSEIHRLKAEFLNAIDPVKNYQSIVENLGLSLEITKKQQAPSYELRTIISMVKFKQQSGDANKELIMLQERYNWFTEGFDTKDLLEAKTLLEQSKSATHSV